MSNNKLTPQNTNNVLVYHMVAVKSFNCKASVSELARTKQNCRICILGGQQSTVEWSDQVGSIYISLVGNLYDSDVYK